MLALYSIIVTSLLLISVIIAISYCHVSNYCVSWYILTRARHAVVFHLFRNAYFSLLVHSSRKLWPKPDNFAPFILPCKIGGSQNLMKERYLSKTPFLTFVYLSKCNIKLPGYFGNSKKRFLWTGLLYTFSSIVNYMHATILVSYLIWWSYPEGSNNLKRSRISRTELFASIFFLELPMSPIDLNWAWDVQAYWEFHQLCRDHKIKHEV